MIIFAAQYSSFYMISRRNIRIKVMQVLYAGLQEDASTPNIQALLKSLRNQIHESSRLAVTLIYVITEVARYAEKDAMIRASKHLPTGSDLNVNTKLAGNSLLWQILEMPSYKRALSELKPELIIEDEWIRKIYIELTSSPTYHSYILSQSREKKEEKNILEYIFKDLILPNEGLTDHIEERFMNWQDDSEMMELLILNFLHKPDTYNFQEFVSRDKN
jgi:N utilization substance protein B